MAVKKALKSLHTNHYSHAHERVEECRIKLAAIHEDQGIRNDKFQPIECQLNEKLRHWSRVEESILRHQSRIQWLSLGDANTKIFFTATKVRKARNKIVVLQNEEGDLLHNKDDIQRRWWIFISSYWRLVPPLYLLLILIQLGLVSLVQLHLELTLSNLLLMKKLIGPYLQLMTLRRLE